MITQDGQDKAHDPARRHRRAAITSAVNIVGRAVAFATSLATISLVLQYLSREGFGLWMILTSLVALFGFADLGIGNGIVNAVASANGRDDMHRIREVVSSAVSVLSIIAVAIVIISAIAVPRIDWKGAFGISGDLVAVEAPMAFAVFFACFAAGIPASIVMRVQMGLQQGYIAGAWQALGTVAGFLGVLVAIRMGGGLPWLTAALLGGPLVAALINSVVFFGFTRPDLRPSNRLSTVRIARELLQLGGLFLVLQIAVSLAFASDNLIAAGMLGAAEVVDYAVAVKLFSITSVLSAILLQPLWPAYAEAIARRDVHWVRRTLRASTVGAAVLAVLLAILLLGGFDQLTHLWLHRELQVSWILLSGLAVWTILEAVGVSVSMFLNGAHVVGLQVVLASAFAVTCVVLKVVAVGRYGVDGLPWATIASYCMITLLPLSLLLKGVIARL